jgi:hypothetical protein
VSSLYTTGPPCLIGLRVRPRPLAAGSRARHPVPQTLVHVTRPCARSPSRAPVRLLGRRRSSSTYGRAPPDLSAPRSIAASSVPETTCLHSSSRNGRNHHGHQCLPPFPSTVCPFRSLLLRPIKRSPRLRPSPSVSPCCLTLCHCSDPNRAPAALSILRPGAIPEHHRDDACAEPHIHRLFPSRIEHRNTASRSPTVPAAFTPSASASDVLSCPDAAGPGRCHQDLRAIKLHIRSLEPSQRHHNNHDVGLQHPSRTPPRRYAHWSLLL